MPGAGQDAPSRGKVVACCGADRQAAERRLYTCGPGFFLCNYWVSDQCLATGGVEIGAELWEAVRRAPDESCLIPSGASGVPHESPGRELAKLVESKVLTLYPAKYRLAERAGGGV